MVLRLRIPAPDWQKAKCLGIAAGLDYDPFFEEQSEALQFCNGLQDGEECYIRHHCLIFALTNNLKEGVWGGTSELTRRAIRRRWPLIGMTPRPEWEWMSERDAVAGLRPVDLIEDEEDEE